MGMLYDIKLPKISCNTINIHLCDRTVSTIDLCISPRNAGETFLAVFPKKE